MKLYKTREAVWLVRGETAYALQEDWDDLVNREPLYEALEEMTGKGKGIPLSEAAALSGKELMPPIGSQEVWAAGVTYLRSRDARMEEAKTGGGADFYDKVYTAERPELFLKALPHRVAGHGQEVHIRRDSGWNVPEPELTLLINVHGNVCGYTIGNDMSSRSIEGENPLYLPQAKVYDRSAALGPCLYVPAEPIPPDTAIAMSIFRKGEKLYADQVQISRMKRSFTELAGYLYRECDFPYGSFLMTGTCLVPPNDFTLEEGDVVDISISPIGTLSNTVRRKK